MSKIPIFIILSYFYSDLLMAEYVSFQSHITFQSLKVFFLKSVLKSSLDIEI